MGTSSIGTARQELLDKYNEEAEELGISRAEYMRKCIQIGRLTFLSSGEVDIDRLRELTEKKSVSTETDIETSNGDLTEAIMRNLPTDERRALSKKEIREVVFGTRSEQQEQITQALKHLRKAGMIEPLIDDGYIKTGEYDGE
jgi:hypothetical protein